ncbi:ATP-dependent RNA helicase CshB [Mycoplasmoides fastidiosum]|uniref:ATP-dependent RNA helicase CshB n=1 Tax=Mycoplasmoides fastidiosum TaxID=92758 RepID=A0ABU0LYH8_9BACT|nr:DEAD/DEAH box helicase [Mycoplasmoides fastidiosum]MDQ0513771.1 ATP-dependent RNA helicase CshB [Mycoplasmoides fastidiosum]UUD37811.1 DEAD/DEAH box helicase [Mycoplasmoides fastidiosum]
MKKAQWKLTNNQLVDELIKNKFLYPNPAQIEIFDNLNRKNNSILVAPTGTGKTISLLIFLIDYLLKKPDQKAFFVFPTKELIQQVFDVAKQLNFTKLIKVVILNKTTKIENLIQKHLILATPERLKVFSKEIKNHLQKFRLVLALDEVDVLIEMGFLNDIQFFIKENRGLITKKIAASATIPKGLMQQLKIWFKTYESLIFNQKKITESKHYYLITRPEKKNNDLLVILDYLNTLTGSIVFFNTKKELESVHQWVVQNSQFRPILFHGEMQERERIQAMNLINHRNIVTIFATDLLARGISIKHLQMVINYEMPKDNVWYMHRSGRTGRYNQPGKIISLVTDNEFNIINHLTKKDIKFYEAKLNNKKIVFKDQTFKKIKINENLETEIKQIIAKAPKKIKPNYKKKIKVQIKKAKTKAKRQEIEKNIKKKLIDKWKEESRIKRTTKEKNG